MKSITRYRCQKLLDFIDEKAFKKVLDLPSETYTGNDEQTFQSFIRAVHLEREKLRACNDPAKLKDMFLNEICPETIKESLSGQFGFHSISSRAEIRKEFINLCKLLDVK
jgi:hypothetical protein